MSTLVKGNSLVELCEGFGVFLVAVQRRVGESGGSRHVAGFI